MELGALYRIALVAWGMGCTLPADDAFLAAVARTTEGQWREMRARVLASLGAMQAPDDRASLTFEGLLRLESETRAEADRRRARTAAATKAAADRSRRQTTGPEPPSRVRDGSVTEPLRTSAPSLRSEFSSGARAPALQRKEFEFSSSLSSDLTRAPQQNDDDQSARDVLASLSAGARALGEEAVGKWRREKSLRMLQDAIARWKAKGVTSCPVGKASELADLPSAEPARVQYLVEDADSMVARMLAEGKRPNPVGLVIAGLGASERRTVPREVPMFLSEKWAKAEADARRMLEVSAAVRARMVRPAAGGPAGKYSAG